MSEISLETVTGKLNRLGYDAFMRSLRHAKKAGNRNVELAHWMLHILSNDRSDISLALDHYKVDRARALKDLTDVVDGFRKNETEMPGVATQITDVLDRGWHYATLFFGETQIRTGHVLVAALKSPELRRSLSQLSKQFASLDGDAVANDARTVWAQSDEENLRPMDGSGLAAREAGAPSPVGEGARGNTALDRFSVDMTAKAKKGEMDPVVGRDEEIRKIIDVLMRRRQNNPILTGEAGVGKTAVVEGFAQRLADGDVPPQLKGVRLCALDIGLMQAGASMKGEFEQRLRSVIDEVQASPTPIILFIDEAHTLIGAGGAQGTGDAANLLKPALARGTLRTIGATTWAEYRQYFEKDPALTRRFQSINVEEPSVEKCCYMLRGILEPMEKHHRVRISDEAVVAAVHLSVALHPGAAAARQGREPARHRQRPRGDQPEHHAGGGGRPQGGDRRTPQGARCPAARKRSRPLRRGTHRRAEDRDCRHRGETGGAGGRVREGEGDRRRDHGHARQTRGQEAERRGEGRRGIGRARHKPTRRRRKRLIQRKRKIGRRSPASSASSKASARTAA